MSGKYSLFAAALALAIGVEVRLFAGCYDKKGRGES